MKYFIKSWREITSDEVVLNCLTGYRIPFISSPSQNNKVTEQVTNAEELDKLKIEVDKLLFKNAIEECEEAAGQFISSVFLVPKPDGTNRFIINLKKLNEFLDPPHFKMEDIRVVKQLVTHGVYMCSIDLKDAYHLIPMHEESKKFLRFKLMGKLYQFSCLPFGLSTSPFIFTKIMKPVVNALRSQGIILVVYLDDFLIMGQTYKQCQANVLKVKRLLEKLGFVINYSKSNFTPSNECKYLGFIVNSEELSLELTKRKKNNILEILNRLKKDSWYKIRDAAQLLGMLTASWHAMAYGSVYCKRLERQKFLALRLNGNNYEGKMLIDNLIMEDIDWWKANIITGKNLIRRHRFKREIFSDSSLSGWGCFCNGVRTAGFWGNNEKKFHINHLELLAAFFALKCFASDLRGEEILLRLDNTTAIAYVNKTGGIQFPHLSELAREIWLWCEQRDLFVVASYIPSAENIEADAASRITNIDTEWELSSRVFKEIDSKFGPFTIDLFATRLNTKCRRFCSRYQDPEAAYIDALTSSWSKEKFYAFPPFAMILRTLRKIINDKARGVVIVPNWPTQPWFPLFNSLLEKPPLLFNPNRNLLVSPCRRLVHPLVSNLSLVAGKLSGRRI